MGLPSPFCGLAGGAKELTVVREERVLRQLEEVRDGVAVTVLGLHVQPALLIPGDDDALHPRILYVST